MTFLDRLLMVFRVHYLMTLALVAQLGFSLTTTIVIVTRHWPTYDTRRAKVGTVLREIAWWLKSLAIIVTVIWVMLGFMREPEIDIFVGVWLFVITLLLGDIGTWLLL